MATNRGTSFLSQNQFLYNDEYLISDNGVSTAWMLNDGSFVVYVGTNNGQSSALWATGTGTADKDHFAIMQVDGNFCIYFGTGSGDNQGSLWSAHTTPPDGSSFYAVIQDDGNSYINQGIDPNDCQGSIWRSGNTDPVVSIEDITNMQYDIAHAKVISTSSISLGKLTLHNTTPVSQVNSISQSFTYAETHGWSDTAGISVTVKSTLQFNVPIIFDGKVEVSVQGSYSYSRNQSTISSNTFTYTGSVNVQPNTIGVVNVSMQSAEIAVPFTANCVYTLRSGSKVPGILRGIYAGSSCDQSSVDASISYVDPINGNVIVTKA
jgi:hypothetical protein